MELVDYRIVNLRMPSNLPVLAALTEIRCIPDIQLNPTDSWEQPQMQEALSIALQVCDHRLHVHVVQGDFDLNTRDGLSVLPEDVDLITVLLVVEEHVEAGSGARRVCVVMD